jgi:DNA polymerase-3 subunit epsilon
MMIFASRVHAVSASTYAKFMSTSGTLATFDLETTGVDVETSRIVSACIAIVDASGVVVSRWDWLADPGVDIPEGAAAIHGISTERARSEGRQAAIVVAEIAQTLKATCALGIPLVVYNAPYDLSLLDRECRRYSINGLVEPYFVIDPLVIDKAVDRYRRGKRTLEVTSGLYGVALDDAHDAGSDAIAAARVAQALLAKFTEELSIPFSELHDRQRQWYSDQAVSFQEYMRSSKGDHSFVANGEWPVRSFPQ